MVAAGRRDDPVKFERGIVAIYEAGGGRTVREVPQSCSEASLEGFASTASIGRWIVILVC